MDPANREPVLVEPAKREPANGESLTTTATEQWPAAPESPGNSQPIGSDAEVPRQSEYESGSEESFLLRYQLVIRSHDQLIVWLLIVACMAGMALYFWLRIQTEGGLIDIERAAPQKPAVYLVDINTASWPELDNLPGIGAGLAQAIIDHREAFGPFRNLEELQQVDGIGPARLSSLLPYLLKPEDREEPLTHGLDSIGISDGD